MKEYLSEAAEVLSRLKTGKSGLTGEEAAARREQYGLNKLKEGKKVPLFKRFLAQLADPMVLILIAAAVISAVTSSYSGDSFADVIIIMIVVVVNSVLGVVQESKAEKAIEALREITAATSKVLRDGRQVTLRSEELVPGDVILLEAGDAVPADARLLECASLKAEESALTGESVPVSKTADKLTPQGAKDVPLGDRKNMVYMGSTVVYGRGRAVVAATGMDTEMGKIAGVLAATKNEQTPLQVKLGQLSRILSILVICICVVIFGVSLLRSYPNVTGAKILDTFMVAVSLAVAAIPEGLVAVVTVSLSIGVTKMSKRSAVIRRLTAVETLGCTQVICSDKTGTLTQNKMTVTEHFSEDTGLLALAMALCSDARPGENGRAEGEPTECALVDDALSLGVYPKDGGYGRIGEAPFDSQRKMMSVVCLRTNGSMMQFTKGAPDVVLKHCTKMLKNGEMVPMTDAMREEIIHANRAMAGRALRVLCGAMRAWESVPSTFEPAHLEKNLCFVGLSGMIDPVRPEVRDAIRECRGAGIRPVMITGDHRDTAAAIAGELGILGEGQEAITGAELDDLSDEELAANVERYSVYARVQPEHKVRIVRAWKKHGRVTAMTGDGVNDAPSIKTADIGVGMGITGTDVTKNVADMVLADDNFATIVSAVEEGRRVYDNIRKAIQFLLSSNLAEVLSIFAATMLGFTILRPVHLLWINLITDCFPALALGMEKSERDIMTRPPRDPRDGIFADGMGPEIAFQGLVITALTLLSYFVGDYLETGMWRIVNSADGMTMAFLTLSLVEMFHSFNMRSRRHSVFAMREQNVWLWAALIGSFICTTLVVYVPFLASAFDFQEISFREFAVAVGLAISILPIVELEKVFLRAADRKKTRKNN